MESKRSLRENGRVQETAHTLWNNAIIAGSFATIPHKPGVRYRRKGSYISELYRLIRLDLQSVDLSVEGMVLTVGFDYRRTKVLFHEIDQDVQAEISPVVSLLLMQRIDAGENTTWFE